MIAGAEVGGPAAIVARSVVSRLLTLVVLSLLAFALARAAPGDPAEITLRASGEEPTPEAVRALRTELGLDRGPLEQYLAWAGRALRLDFGTSFVSRRPVGEALLERLPATLQLTAAAFALAAIVGLGGGLLAAWRRGAVDHLTWAFAALGASVPTYWSGLLLTYVFGVLLGWLPVAGDGSWRHLVLPACTLAFGFAALQLRLFRAGLLVGLEAPFAVVAAAKGLSRWQILTRHALPRALGPNLHALGMTAGHLLGGAMVTETVFAWPGVGRLAVESILRRDFPVIQSYVLVLGTVYILLTLTADLAHAWWDPLVRARSSGGVEA